MMSGFTTQMAAVNIQERFRDVNARVEGMVANLRTFMVVWSVLQV